MNGEILEKEKKLKLCELFCNLPDKQHSKFSLIQIDQISIYSFILVKNIYQEWKPRALVFYLLIFLQYDLDISNVNLNKKENY